MRTSRSGGQCGSTPLRSERGKKRGKEEKDLVVFIEIAICAIVFSWGKTDAQRVNPDRGALARGKEEGKGKNRRCGIDEMMFMAQKKKKRKRPGEAASSAAFFVDGTKAADSFLSLLLLLIVGEKKRKGPKYFLFHPFLFPSLCHGGGK